MPGAARSVAAGPMHEIAYRFGRALARPGARAAEGNWSDLQDETEWLRLAGNAEAGGRRRFTPTPFSGSAARAAVAVSTTPHGDHDIAKIGFPGCTRMTFSTCPTCKKPIVPEQWADQVSCTPCRTGGPGNHRGGFDPRCKRGRCKCLHLAGPSIPSPTHPSQGVPCLAASPASVPTAPSPPNWEAFRRCSSCAKFKPPQKHRNQYECASCNTGRGKHLGRSDPRCRLSRCQC